MLILLIALFLAACGKDEKPRPILGEFIYRKQGEVLFQMQPPRIPVKETYPWEKGRVGKLPKITKEYFRCKGSSLNPARTEYREGEAELIHDCGGSEKHSLPLKEGKEYVYPILINLLNYIQAETKRRVVITSAHRCPDHNAYVNPSSANQTSKHCVGAEVSFYVQGLEDKPEHIVKLIQKFYSSNPDKKYADFKRYEKNDTDVITLPWYNHEIFIKLYQKKEGRDFDNRHPYPYLSLQVRAEGDRKIQYTYHDAYNNYLRY